MKNILTVLYFCLILGGCMTKQDYVLISDAKTNANAMDNNKTSSYKIKKGDRLAIIVAKHPEISTRSDLVPPSSDLGILVTSNGWVSVPLIGYVSVENMTLCEATAAVTEKLLQFIKNPQVTIDLINPKVFIIGEVNKPGAIRVDKNVLNIMEALAYAEDFSTYADRSSIKIIRGNPKNPDVYEVDMTKIASIKKAPPIFPGDIIYVEPNGLKMVNTNIGQILLALTGSVFYLDNVITRKTRF